MSQKLKIASQWKDRPLDAVAKDLEAAVCDAAVRWEQQRQGLGINEELPTKKARIDGAAEHFPQTDGNDHALIKWLQTQEADAHCRSLLHQIRQWTGREGREDLSSTISGKTKI